MKSFTHRSYFRRYRLNVEQYAEILVADAVSGVKLGDTQHGYDIKCDSAGIAKLCPSRTDTPPTESSTVEFRIEVKAKSWREGKADVVHCSDLKLKEMTHLAIVIVHDGRPDSSKGQEGDIMEAWLLTTEQAKATRCNGTIKKYISAKCVSGKAKQEAFWDIKKALQDAADKPLDSNYVE